MVSDGYPDRHSRQHIPCEPRDGGGDRAVPADLSTAMERDERGVISPFTGWEYLNGLQTFDGRRVHEISSLPLSKRRAARSTPA